MNLALNVEQQQMYDDNIRLVYQVLHDLNCHAADSEWDDCFQEGCIQLVKCVKLFKPELGNKFSAYAYPSIWGCINTWRRRHLRTVHIPRTDLDAIPRILEYRKLHPDCTTDDLAKLVHMTRFDVSALLCASGVHTASLDAVMSNDEDDKSDAYVSMIVSNDDGLTDWEHRENVLDAIHTVCDNLSAPVRKVFTMYAESHLSGEYKTQEDISAVAGIKQSCVSRDIRKAQRVYRQLKKDGVL